MFILRGGGGGGAAGKNEKKGKIIFPRGVRAGMPITINKRNGSFLSGHTSTVVCVKTSLIAFFRGAKKSSKANLYECLCW